MPGIHGTLLGRPHYTRFTVHYTRHASIPLRQFELLPQGVHRDALVLNQTQMLLNQGHSKCFVPFSTSAASVRVPSVIGHCEDEQGLQDEQDEQEQDAHV